MNETYKKVLIKGKADLPKTAGEYFCNRNGFMTVQKLSPNLPEKSFQREIRWYLQPLDNDVRDQIIEKLEDYVEYLKVFPHTSFGRDKYESELNELKKKMK
jgi:hypothetical protein